MIKNTLKFSIIFSIIVIVISVFFFNINQEKVDDYNQENPCQPIQTKQDRDKLDPCDKRYVNRYNMADQEPLNKMHMIDTWDIAKKILTVGNVIEPLYIPDGFELKYLYYYYHDVDAFYGLTTIEFDTDVICPMDYENNGFVIEYNKSGPKIHSTILSTEEIDKILKTMIIKSPEK